MEALAVSVALLTMPVPEPPEAVLSRFPPANWGYVVLARTHIKWLETEIAVYPWKRDRLEAWIMEAHKCEEAWRFLDGGSKPQNPEQAEYLAELRRVIGDDAYFAGRMPPPMPIWYFTEIGR